MTQRATSEKMHAQDQGVRVCILCADFMQASHLQEKYRWTRETAIMIVRGHKKDVHLTVEIHYNTSHHEQRLVEGGLARVAGQSCLAGPSVLRLHPYFGHCRSWEYGKESGRRVKLFCAPHPIFLRTTGRNFVVTFFHAHRS